MSDILAIDDVSVSYGRVEAVRGVTMTMPRGAIVSVIGVNGAGKTTLLTALMGLQPMTGTVVFDGQNISHLSVDERVAEGIVLVPEKRNLFGSMSVQDNLVLGAFRRGRSALRTSLEEIFALFPRLAERRTQLARTLSGGERQMLALGRGLMAQPRLLMLDEPSLGLAPLIVKQIMNTISDLRDRDMSILLVEQNAREALRISDFGYLMELGRTTMNGPSRELAQNPRILETYLGMAAQHSRTI